MFWFYYLTTCRIIPIDIHPNCESSVIHDDLLDAVFSQHFVHSLQPAAPLLDEAHVVECLGKNLIANLRISGYDSPSVISSVSFITTSFPLHPDTSHHTSHKPRRMYSHARSLSNRNVCILSPSQFSFRRVVYQTDSPRAPPPISIPNWKLATLELATLPHWQHFRTAW